MLAKPHAYLQDAVKNHYAIGAFNASNLEVAQAIIRAGVAQESVVIVQTSESAIDYAGLNVLVAMVRAIAEEASVPVILHLDHGKSFERAKACIDAGYTSVMIDASTKPFEENISLTKHVVEYAHERGIWVEAELGSILGKEGAVNLHGASTPESMFTDPNQAAQFISETGADALAVSVGTIHGAFSGQEFIRFELLDTIRAAVPSTPLVIHGASGLPDDDLKKVATMQVCKINVDTELRIAFDTALRAQLGEHKEMVDPRVILGVARDATQKVVTDKINLFGSSQHTHV